MMDTLVNIFLLIVAGAFAIGSSVIIHQDKLRAKERKVFDKSDIEYRDGDNT